LDRLVATALRPAPQGLVPEGGYKKRLHKFDGSLSLPNYLVGKDARRFSNELVVYLKLSALGLLRDSVH
jgi:hypothetical protein